MTLTRRLACTFAVACSTALFTAGAAWSDDAVIHVSLSDKGDMDMMEGMGMGMSGVDMSMATMSITATPEAVKAGKVTFEVTNDSTGTIHEMIVAPVPADGTMLPYDDNMLRVDEDAARSLGEVSELEPGDSGALTVNLEPGAYILYCNIPGHYMTGMWTLIQVEP